MAKNEVTLNHLDGLHFRVRLSHSFRLRVWLAIQLMRLAARVMQANIDIAEGNNGEPKA